MLGVPCIVNISGNKRNPLTVTVVNFTENDEMSGKDLSLSHLIPPVPNPPTSLPPPPSKEKDMLGIRS